MYKIFSDLLIQNGVTPYKVSKETGIPTSTFTEWKKGTYTPKVDKLQKIADYFNVSLEYLTTGETSEQKETPLAKARSEEHEHVIKMLEAASPEVQRFVLDALEAEYKRRQGQDSGTK